MSNTNLTKIPAQRFENCCGSIIIKPNKYYLRKKGIGKQTYGKLRTYKLKNPPKGKNKR